tara:strand:+ start:1154 stop:2128 length:975 start_codon:yes stop_codon:yes gene_type:complete
MEYMPNFKLYRPDITADAVKIRSEQPEALYLAGGTDLMVNVRRGIEQPKHIIDLTAITELQAIGEDDEGLHIGSGVHVMDIAENDKIKSDYPAIAEAADAVAGPTHRQYATIGGNLCLDTRCLFYNQSEWWRQSNDYCLKERGDTCHVASGGQKCFAAFSGDVAPAMLVYEAEVDLVGPEGSRRVPLVEIYENDGMAHLNLQPGELLTVIHLPKPLAGSPSRYEKARIRGSIDFPLAGVAVRLSTDGSSVKELAIALTGVGSSPQVIKKTEEFVGQALDEDVLETVKETVRKQAKPMKTTTVAPWYRRRVVSALAKRLTAELAG